MKAELITPYRIIIEAKKTDIFVADFEILVDDEETPYEKVEVGTYAVYLTSEQYNIQMLHPNSLWHCPYTGAVGEWDDDHYEKYL